MKQLSPLKSIKKYCKVDCCCNDLKSWKYCTRTSCSLYKYRLGIGNREKKQKLISTLQDSIKLKPSDKQESLI